MASERILNQYYNRGGFNKPNLIGYMMSMIRRLQPLTEDEWKVWYLSNIHDESYINNLANHLYKSIPEYYHVTEIECINYVYDVMFRRTFDGFRKENQALKLLREKISPTIEQAPKEWDTEYFIDFYAKSNKGQIIGIQLKPETFYIGHYNYVVDIDGKINQFCNKFNAKAYILKYIHTDDVGVSQTLCKLQTRM